MKRITVFITVLLILLSLFTACQRNVYMPPNENRKEAMAPYESDIGVVFSVKHATARKISIIGDFNNWNPKRHQMIKNKFNVWSISLPLPKGAYTYKFNIDGVEIIDPNNSAVAENRQTGEARSYIEVSRNFDWVEPPGDVYGPTEAAAPYPTDKGMLFSYYSSGANDVFVAGTWSSWQEKIPLTMNENNVWTAEHYLPRGQYYYRYFVDGMWMNDPQNPRTTDAPFNEKFNILLVTNILRVHHEQPAITDLIPYAFEYENYDLSGDSLVSLIGEFNSWNSELGKMYPWVTPNRWETVSYLKTGNIYHYCFWVEGQEILDNNNLNTADYNGREVNVIEPLIPPGTALIRFTYTNNTARQVSWIGEYNHWNELRDPFIKDIANNLWVCTIPLPPGIHSYRFWVDGKQVLDPKNYNTAADRGGDQFSRVIIKSNAQHGFQIYRRLRKGFNWADVPVSDM